MFNSESSLYDQTQLISDFYDTSNSSLQINNATGLPFGFFHYPLPGTKHQTV